MRRATLLAGAARRAISEGRPQEAPAENAERRRREALKRRILRRRGFFVTFEGVEGSGKSLQIARLARFLLRNGISVLSTKEPGGTAAGGVVRRLFLDPRSEALDPWTELFLMEAARAQHLAEVVRPALFSGTTVLCDRFTDSTLAYQGHGRHLPLDVIRYLHRLAGLRPEPDLTVIFDLPVERALARAQKRNAQSARRRREGRIDEEGASFHRRVRRGYLAIAAEDPGRVVIVPAGASPDVVERRVRAIVLPRLGFAHS